MRNRLAQVLGDVDPLLPPWADAPGGAAESRLDAPTPETVHAGDILEAALERCRPLLDERGSEVSATLPASPVHLHCDREGMVRVVATLLDGVSRTTPADVQITAVVCDLIVGVAFMIAGAGDPRRPSGPCPDPREAPEHAEVPHDCAGLVVAGAEMEAARSIMERQGGFLFAVDNGPVHWREFVAYLPRRSVARGAARRQEVS